MAVPKKRKTKSGTRRRRSHLSLSKINLGKCQNCSAAILPHRICKECGAYRGKIAAKAVSGKTPSPSKT